MTGKTTIVIPCGQVSRVPDLEASLTHCVNTGVVPHCRVIIADGLSGALAGLSSRFGVGHMVGASDVHERIGEALGSVATPYVVTLGDDDRIYLDGLQACERALDDAPGGIVAHGQYLGVWDTPAGPRKSPWYVDIPHVDPDPVARVCKYFANYRAPIFYAMARTEPAKRIYKGLMGFRALLQGGFNFPSPEHADAMCHEFAHAGPFLALGKVLRVPEHYIDRKWIGARQMPYSEILAKHKDAYQERVNMLCAYISLYLDGPEAGRAVFDAITHYLSGCVEEELARIHNLNPTIQNPQSQSNSHNPVSTIPVPQSLFRRAKP